MGAGTRRGRPGALGANGGKPGKPSGDLGVSDVASEFNADERSAARSSSPVTIAGVPFRRRVKDWDISLSMRALMRAQESAVARSNRLGARVQELEADQIEAAASGETEKEEALEGTIEELIGKSDEATVIAERTTYRLLALLLEPPEDAAESFDELDADVVDGFGVLKDESRDDSEATAWLARRLDSTDALVLARVLAGQREPDPQMTPSSGGSSS